MKIRVTLKCVREDSWRDFEEDWTGGRHYIFEVRDPRCGTWELSLLESSRTQKIVVKVLMRPRDCVFSTLDTKSAIFKPSIIPGMHYHLVKISTLEWEWTGPRLRLRTVEAMSDLPPELSKFRFCKYYEATGNRHRVFANKLVVLIPHEDRDEMVEFFVYEKIYPLLEHECERGEGLTLSRASRSFARRRRRKAHRSRRRR